MATIINAKESTGNIPSGRAIRDVQEGILYLDPNAAPFTLLSQKAGTRKVQNVKYEWIEQRLAPQWDAVNNGGGYTSGATSVVVDNGAYFNVNDIVNVPRTGEKMRVTAIASNTLTVSRGVGTTAAAALVDDDDLQVVGTGYAEGALSQTEKQTTETYPYNYTQIFRLPFGVTGSQDQSENYTGKDRPRLRAEKAVEHALQLERAAIFGERNLDNSNTNAPVRYTGGFLNYATSNVQDMGGTMTEAEIETWCESIFNPTTPQGDTRVLFAAARPVSVLNQLAAGRLEMVPGDKTYGIQISQYQTAHGTLLITKHRLLENGKFSEQGAIGGSWVGTSTLASDGYGGYMLAVAPKLLRFCPLGNRSTKLVTDIQEPDRDGWKDEYLTEAGFQVALPEAHGIAKNITG